MVFPVAGQKSNHVGQTLSSLMLDVCQLLGVRKLNTTAYHGGKVQPNPKIMLRKQASTHGLQWDKFLSGVVGHIETPLTSFLLFGKDCRSSIAAPYK